MKYENTKKYIQVTNKIWEISDTQVEIDGAWEKARPILYAGNIIEMIQHWFGKHFSYGQPYCVVCGKSEAPQERVEDEDTNR